MNMIMNKQPNRTFNNSMEIVPKTIISSQTMEDSCNKMEIETNNRKQSIPTNYYEDIILTNLSKEKEDLKHINKSIEEFIKKINISVLSENDSYLRDDILKKEENETEMNIINVEEMIEITNNLMDKLKKAELGLKTLKLKTHTQ